MKTKIIFRKAKISDAAKIKKLIDYYAREEIMLFRPIYAIYGDIRDFFVAEKRGEIIGCSALHVFGREYEPDRKGSVLAEVRSLAVAEKHHNQGIGTKLVEGCIKEAKNMEINKLFTLTTPQNVIFFKRIGFKETRKSGLPQKIWQECTNCPRFPDDCNEVSLILNL